MNQCIRIILVAVLFISAASCDRDEVFEREQYKNVFAIVSGDYNVHTVLHDFREPVSTGYISASLGGSKRFDKDIVITLEEDDAVLLDYNKTLYQEDRDRYVKPLNKNKYAFDNGYKMTIKAGETYAELPVTVRPEGLSPDSVFYIALRVDTYNAGELNMEKGTVLYEVRVKNWWAMFNGTNYVSRGIRYEEGAVPTNLYVNKSLYPFGPATIRAMAGAESERDAQGNLYYKEYAMMLTISNDTIKQTIDGVVKNCSPINIAPYALLDIAAVGKNDPDYDPDYPNVAIGIDDDGYRIYKTILLHYRFTDSNGRVARVKEEMRFEYIEDPKDPRFLN